MGAGGTAGVRAGIGCVGVGVGAIGAIGSPSIEVEDAEYAEAAWVH